MIGVSEHGCSTASHQVQEVVLISYFTAVLHIHFAVLILVADRDGPDQWVASDR